VLLISNVVNRGLQQKRHRAGLLSDTYKQQVSTIGLCEHVSIFKANNESELMLKTYIRIFSHTQIYFLLTTR
jgi:hypothetical protein